ncbi:MAG: methylglyoxal synthase [Clostridia bacterium]|nr:methylglyoxal synthase [Clostridia bacterium]
MEIALIADDSKKELMTQFCIAYCGILSKHNLYATNTTGKQISEATGLEIETLLPGSHGGTTQITSRISYNEIDALLYFRSTNPNERFKEAEYEMIRMCDIHNIPVATNIASAEILINAIDRGDLDWRSYVNPKHSGDK